MMDVFKLHYHSLPIYHMHLPRSRDIELTGLERVGLHRVEPAKESMGTCIQNDGVEMNR